jgi:hypothetical protein
MLELVTKLMTILYKEKKLAEIQENEPKWLFFLGGRLLLAQEQCES